MVRNRFHSSAAAWRRHLIGLIIGGGVPSSACRRSGGLFALDVGVKGLTLPAFTG
jgi:hypothetical protein